MIETKGATVTVIQLDKAQFDQLLNEIQDLKGTVKELKQQAEHRDKYPWLGEWITAKEAFKLLPFKDNRTLTKWVERGIIQAKVIAENGNKRAYRKSDVLSFAEKAERHLQG